PCFARALSSNPGDTVFLMNHAAALVHLERFGEALTDYDRIAAIAPDFPCLSGQIALAALFGCDWTRMDAVSASLPAQVEADTPGFSPWDLIAYGLDAPLLRRAARQALRPLLSDSGPPLWTGQAYDHDRIRLAYVS